MLLFKNKLKINGDAWFFNFQANQSRTLWIGLWRVNRALNLPIGVYSAIVYSYENNFHSLTGCV